MAKISATRLAKNNDLKKHEVDSILKEKGYLERNEQDWELTSFGKEAGGEYKESDKFGKFIVWPENILQEEETGKIVTARVIAKHFGISSLKVNPILSELGWINKGLKGWFITEQGKKQKGFQKEDKKSGVPYVAWSESILTNKSLLNSINELQGTDGGKSITVETKREAGDEFRQKFKAEHRCTDGHNVRSKAEALIDNWLYMAEVIHAYERKLPVEEDVYCDFYLPTGKVYIEYWGYEEAEKYLKRKQEKQAIYQKYDFNLIELSEKEVQNLDDVLPRELLKHGIKTY